MKITNYIECGQALQKKSATQYVCPSGHEFWNNPKAAATTFLIKGNQALFAKRARDPKKGTWDIPGGFLEFGEDPEDAAKREILEETGLSITKLDLLMVQTNPYDENVDVLEIIFVTTEWDGQEPRPHDDVAALEWRPVDQIVASDFSWDYKKVLPKIKAYISSRD